MQNGEDDDHLSDNADADEALTEAAAKIEAQLSTPASLDKKEEEDSPLAVRVSPRRRPLVRSLNEESDRTMTAHENVTDNGPCRALRSGKKIPESSDGEAKGSSMLATSKASKKLQMDGEPGLSNSKGGIALERARKRGRGRPRKEDRRRPEDRIRTEDKMGLVDKVRPEEKMRPTDQNVGIKQVEHLPSASLQGRISTLSSSEDEAEKPGNGKRNAKKKNSRISSMRTRSKAKKLDPSKEDEPLEEDSNQTDADLNEDLALSSDGESKHSLYNPRDSESSDGSDQIVATRQRKRVSSDGHTLRRSSALSDSSDSDDNAEHSAKSKGQGVKVGRETAKGDLETLNGSTTSSVKLVGDSKVGDEGDSESRHERRSKRMIRSHHILKAQHPDAADKTLVNNSPDDSSNTHDCVEDPVVSENRDSKENSPSGDMKDSRALSPKSSPSSSNVTRSRTARLLRSKSSPTTSSKTSSMEIRSIPKVVTRSSSRDNSLSLETNVQATIAAKDSESLQQKPEDTSPPEKKRFVRSTSSNARLTRSSQQKVDIADNDNSSNQDPLTFAESVTNSHSSQFPRKRLSSRKRYLAESQVSSDEKGDELQSTKENKLSSEDKDSNKVKEERDNREDDESAAKTEGKMLLRSETEEFVVSMDDVFSGSHEAVNQENSRTADDQSERQPLSHESNKKDRGKSHIRRSKRIKRSSSDSHQDNEEVTHNVEPHMPSESPEGPSGGSRMLENDADLNQPGTSSSLADTERSSRAEPAREQESLVPGHRERQLSAASLPSSGRNSPISPIQEPFQGFSEMRPISPMSPERPLERVSPILPFFFDLPSIPRMVSPLPPSPPRMEQEDTTRDEREEFIEQVMPDGIPETQNQPRMISPLFPTPVPFAVSPIPEMPVPPVISPIVDIQHPPEISPIVDVQSPAEVSPISNLQPPVLDVQNQQNTSPGKSPQLPSPMNFHSVAPSDAITVRPQHSSPSYCQDKTSAIRSLSSVLDSNDNEDHRSGFSKMIARRSSGEDQLKGKDTSKANHPSLTQEKVGNRDVSEEPTQNTSSSNLADRKSYDTQMTTVATKGSAAESKDSSSNEPNNTLYRKGLAERHGHNSSVNHDVGNPLRKPTRSEEFKMIVPSTSSSDFSEHLKRMDNQKEMTAFSRVIPHHEENKDKGKKRKMMEHISAVSKPADTDEGFTSTQSNKGITETTAKPCGVEKNDSLVDSQMHKEGAVSKKTIPSEGDHTVKAKGSMVGNLWSQMAVESKGRSQKRGRIDWDYPDVSI